MHLTFVAALLAQSRRTASAPPSGGGGGGNTFNAATASRTDVLAAIALTSPGDTVVVPAGTASWSGDISISGITLKGPGQSAGSPTNISAGKVTLTKHSTQMTTLQGFRFTGSDQHVELVGTSSNKFLRVHDNFFNVVSGTWGIVRVNGYLFSSNTISASTPTNADVFQINLGSTAGPAEWLTATSLGTEDTDGTKNGYYEDNTYSGILETAIDTDEGSRAVFRHNTLTDSSLVAHAGGSGTSENDTSIVGHRHLEVYNNTFNRVSNAQPVNKWIWLRGGSGVIANNVMAEASSPDGSSFPNKQEIQLGVGCESSGYPIRYQIGQTADTADSTPDKPLLIFGNTGAGASSGNFISLRGNDTGAGGHTCSTPSTFIQSGRDYQTSNTWGWTAFTYPHPLVPT